MDNQLSPKGSGTLPETFFGLSVLQSQALCKSF